MPPTTAERSTCETRSRSSADLYLGVPFKSEAQRRFLFAKHPDVAREFAAATPRGKKLPEHVKESHARGGADALAYFKLGGEELRLKIPSRTFHGFDAAAKSVARKSANVPDADTLEQMLEQIAPPRTPADQKVTTDHLNRSTAWGAPNNLAGGDAASRVSDMGQSNGFGGT